MLDSAPDSPPDLAPDSAPADAPHQTTRRFETTACDLCGGTTRPTAGLRYAACGHTFAACCLSVGLRRGWYIDCPSCAEPDDVRAPVHAYPRALRRA